MNPRRSTRSHSFYHEWLHRPRMGGFSLVEMLVVIAVIGIMAAIGIMAFSIEHRRAFEAARNRRNAQEIASIAASARAAGADFMVAGDKEQSVRNLMVGVAPTSGNFGGSTFKLSGLTDEDVTAALGYIEIQNGGLIYLAGSGPASTP